MIEHSKHYYEYDRNDPNRKKPETDNLLMDIPAVVCLLLQQSDDQRLLGRFLEFTLENKYEFTLNYESYHH